MLTCQRERAGLADVGQHPVDGSPDATERARVGAYPFCTTVSLAPPASTLRQKIRSKSSFASPNGCENSTPWTLPHRQRSGSRPKRCSRPSSARTRTSSATSSQATALRMRRRREPGSVALVPQLQQSGVKAPGRRDDRNQADLRLVEVALDAASGRGSRPTTTRRAKLERERLIDRARDGLGVEAAVPALEPLDRPRLPLGRRVKAGEPVDRLDAREASRRRSACARSPRASAARARRAAPRSAARGSRSATRR